MPQNQNTFANGDKLAVGTPSQIQIPSKWDEYVSEVPSDVKVVNYAKSVKFTTESVERILRQLPIVGMYHLNVPVIEGAIYVPRYYKWLQVAAQTYQREHDDAFFEQYPDLCILTSDEKAIADTTWLRSNYRMLCKRAAHEFYHYIVASSYLTGALINLLTLSRLDGNEPFKSIAKEVRWSRVNTATQMYSFFPKATGIENLLATSACYTIGEAQDLSDIVAFPYYAVDMMGNRGCHSIPWDSLWTADSENANRSFLLSKGAEVKDHETAFWKLCKHMGDFFGNVRTHEPGKASFDNPYIENGTTQSFECYAEDGTTAKNAASVLLNNGVNRDIANFDNLVTTVWDQWNAWQGYMRASHSQWMDPRSDWVIIGKQMGIIQDSMKPRDILNITRANKAYQLKDLMHEMEYKRGNHVNTSTIIRYIPKLSIGDSDESQISKNYERYNIDRYNDVAQYLASTRAWPRITPTIFFNPKAESDEINNGMMPYVMNASPSVGQEGNDAVCPPIGKHSSLMDLCLSSAIKPENANIESVAITSDDLLDWVKKSDVVVFDESPSDIFALVCPLLDNTDIFQCGINIMISADAGYKTAWDNYFRSKDNLMESEQAYDDSLKCISDNALQPTHLDEIDAPNNPWYAVGVHGSQYGLGHVINPSYLNAMKHCFIFVGAAIGEIPEMLLSHRETGNPTYKFTLNTIGEEDVLSDIIEVKTVYKDFKWEADDVKFKDGFLNLILLSQLSINIVYDNLGHIDIYKMADKAHMLQLQAYEGVAGYIQNEFQHLFNPAYGPIRPAVMPYPAGNILANKLTLQRTADAKRFVAYDEPLSQKMACISVGSIKQGSKPLINVSSNLYNARAMIGNTMDTPAQWYLWFVLRCTIPYAYIKSNGTLAASDKPIKLAVASGCEKWPLNIMVRSRAMYMGANKEYPFWSNELKAEPKAILPQMNDVSQTNITNEQKIIANADTSFTKGPGRGSKDGLHNSKGLQTTFAENGPATKRSSGYERKPYHNNGKSNRGKRRYDNPKRSDSPMDSAVDYQTNDNFADFSTKEVDSKAKFDKKSKPNPEVLMVN